MTHELKTWPVLFDPTWTGAKRAEFRIDDRGYQVGDVLVLREWVPGECRYTGRSIVASVTHILAGPAFGVPDRFVSLSIEVRERRPR